MLMRPSHRLLWIVSALTLLAFAFRVYKINDVPLRGDEAFTLIHWVREPLSHTLADIATVDPQPPLAYFLYWFWGQSVGDSELAVRFLPALFNAVGVPALFALGKRLYGARVGLLSALFWAISPVQIWHGQDARNYALWSVASVLSLWLALRVLQLAVERRDRIWDWLLYLVAASASAYLYYLELFVVITLNVYVLLMFFRKRHVWGRWFVSQAVFAVILSLWYLQERLLVSSGYGGTAGRFDFGGLFSWFLPGLVFGDSLSSPFSVFSVFLLLAVLFIVFLWVVRGAFVKYLSFDILLLFLVIFPLFFLSLVSFRLNVFVPRYVLSVSAMFILLFSISIVRLRASYRFPFLFCLLFLVFSSLFNYFFSSDYAKSPDWRALVGYLAQAGRPSDSIVNTSADEAFTFYHDEYGVPAPFVRLPANPHQDEQEITETLQMLSDSIWLIADTPRDWPNRGVVENWLRANRVQVFTTRIGRLRAEYWTSPVSRSSMDDAVIGQFEDLAAVRSVRMLPPLPDGRLYVLVDWMILGRSNSSLKVFLHLIPSPALPDIPPIAQDDQYPLDGGLDTRTWILGRTFLDVYVLDTSALEPGDYTLMLGLYDPDSNMRVLTTTGNHGLTLIEFSLTN